MNDCIRQAISSSPISLSKIFVASTTSAPALVLRTSMRVCMFRIFMQQRAVIRFLTLKSLRASAIAAEPKLVYETEVFAFSTVKKWRKRFAEGRTWPYDDPRCDRHLVNDLTETISLMLKEKSYLSCKVLCRHFGIAKGTYLQTFHDRLGMKSFILVGFPMPWTRIRWPNESLYQMEFFRYYKSFALLVSRVSSLGMNHRCFDTIPVIRHSRRHEMKCQKESVNKLTQKSV
jgi:hypothetical protein